MNGETIRMLSIDDKTLTTDLDKAGYRSMGVSVRTAASYQDAQDILSRRKIDIIVINHDYRGVNATIVCEHLKKQEETAAIPVVITSVQTSAETRKRCLAAGADLFVEQPIPRQYFIEKLKKILEQKTRGQDRVSFQAEAEVKVNDGVEKVLIADLSATGLLLATEMHYESGTEMEISFVIPGYKKPVTLTGEVVRKIETDPNQPDRIAGLGIRFKDFSGDSQKRLEKFVAKTADKQAQMIYYL